LYLSFTSILINMEEEELLTFSPVDQTSNANMETLSSLPGDGDIANITKDLQLHIHTIPDIASNAQIIGMCGVRPENSTQDKQLWMVLDFIQIKLSLYKKGKRTDQVRV
jgi:hypothetical protein